MIGIIGAGISGLMLGHFLHKKKIPYKIIEATNRVGGYIQTELQEGYVLEKGPNSLLVDNDMLAWLHSLELKEDIIFADNVSQNRYIYKGGKYRKLPMKPLELILSNFFSLSARFRILKESSIAPQNIPHENLYDFVERRFGREVADYVLNPFVAGIYAGNPKDLFVEHTFPQLISYEQQYGSILKALKANKDGIERRKSISFREGLQMLPKKLAEYVDIIYNNPVDKVIMQNQKIYVGSTREEYLFDAVVFCTPAHTSAQLLRGSLKYAAQLMEKVDYPPMCVVHTAFRKKDLKNALNGFGVLHPKIENLYAAGTLWASSIFENRCPKDEVLLTSFVGGSQYATHAEQPEEQIIAKTIKELQNIYEIKEQPVFSQMFSWQKSIPQYNHNILPIWKEIPHLASKNIHVCANWWGGISVADRYKNAKILAEQLATKYK